MAFDSETRNQLARFVGDCRRLLCGDYNRPAGEIARLLAHYGIQVTGEVTEVEQLPHLDESGRDTARLLREILDFKRANIPKTRIWRDYDPAVYDLLQEQAFTVLNRLCALRMAEARGILLPCVSEGTQSQGFQLYEYQSGKSDDTGSRYRHFLFSVFDEIAVDLPALFDRFSPQGLLFPSHSCIEDLLDAINAEPLQSLWAEDETIGWIYQYWNSAEERRAMRDASAAPRNSRELAVRNQFFTPRYVVEFLTDNTLGRIWYEMTKGETKLKEQCRYLVRRPTEIFLTKGEVAPDQPEQEGLSQEEMLKQPVHIPHRPLKDPREIRLLDPACGSMHFGLYAFDLFETIYEEYWERSEDVPSSQRSESVPLSTQKENTEGGTPSLRSDTEGGTPSLPYLNPFQDIEKRRTHLPHWEQPGATYFITWRLADSLPQEKLEAWRQERDAWLKAHPQPWDAETEDRYHRTFSDRLDEWLDAGSGRCVLRDPAIAKIVAGALHHFDRDRYILDSFVVMPNHVHVIVQLRDGEKLDKVLHSWKSFTAKEINGALGETGPVWQEDYFDRIIRNPRHFEATRRYLLENPVKAHLPKDAFLLYDASQRSEYVPSSQRNESVSLSSTQRNESVSLSSKKGNTEGGTPSLRSDTEGGTPSLRFLYPSKEAFLRQVPKLIIEHNIHGVDIDPRAVQIAGLSLWLRAQKTWQANKVPATDRPQIQRSNIVCAEPMPGNKEQLKSFCDSLNQPAIGGLVEHIFDKMQLAGEAGTLLKIEEEITELVATAKKDWLKAPKMKQAELFQPEELATDHRTLATQSELGLDFSGITDEAFWDKAEERIYAALRDYAESAEAGDYQRRLFAEDAAHGFAFIDLCRKRYDAVVMNPPFGDWSKHFKTASKNAYPNSYSDILAAFVDRGGQILMPRGRVGAITSRTCFFLSSFTRWRENVVLGFLQPELLVDLGYGVMDAAMVEAAAYVLAKSSAT